MNRGDRREAVFEDDQDQERFLQTLAEACQKALWQVHAYLTWLLYRQERGQTVDSDIRQYN
jgi:hypothetical protein